MKERIIIDIEYGSQWQKTLHRKTLLTVVSALKMHMKNCHKKNNLRYSISEK